MDFRFRANENKSLPTAADSNSVRSTTAQPLQDGCLNAELMKQKIKEELLIREIACRRMMEAEIRRELLLEQELAKRRAEGTSSENLSIDDLFPLRLYDQIRTNHIVDSSSVPGSSSSPSPVLPFPNLKKEERKPSDDQDHELIVLAKPDAAKFERKRKAKGEELTDKKPAHEGNKFLKFWCEICNIGTPSKTIMISHNNGRKHKARLFKLSQHPKLEHQKDELNPSS